LHRHCRLVAARSTITEIARRSTFVWKDRMDQHEEFRTRLRTALAGRGMTQSELARRLGVRDATVSDWFNRGTMPGGAVMLRLPELLGVDGHWLLTGKHRRTSRAAIVAEATSASEQGEDVSARALALLENAVDLLRSRADGAPVGYLRVRRASADEARALDGVQQHQQREEEEETAQAAAARRQRG
jgi:transcriptional regulator with XRE-family HTH domain